MVSGWGLVLGTWCLVFGALYFVNLRWGRWAIWDGVAMKSVPKRGSVGSCRRVEAGTRMTVEPAAVTDATAFRY